MAVLASGPFANRAVEAAEVIKAEKGWSPAIYNIRYIKPLDEQLVREISEKYGKIVTIEDGTIIGGLYGAVAELVSSMKDPVPVTGVGIPDKYIGQATQEEQREECGLSKESILRLFEEIFAEI